MPSTNGIRGGPVPRLAASAIAVLVLLWLTPSLAHGRTFRPPRHRIFHNEFDINHWPAARHAIRHFLNRHRFDPYPRGPPSAPGASPAPRSPRAPSRPPLAPLGVHGPRSRSRSAAGGPIPVPMPGSTPAWSPLRAARAPLTALAAVVAVALAPAGSAAAKGFVPHHHKIFHGVSDTTNNHDFHRFAHQVGAHPALLEDFYHWDTPLTSGALRRWHQTRTRGVLSLSTAPGGGKELISPRQIADGRDDHYLVRLNHSIAQSNQVVYIRLFPEMNGSWNPYSAYRPDGTKKDRSHSTNNFRRAWQRAALIIRGGRTRMINRELRQRHMPRILRASSNHDPIYKPEDVHRFMPHTKVAFMWTPQTISSPNIAGNQPGDYWPGGRFVDWVGADIYSKFASAGVWRAWKRFYAKWRHKPFVVGEYSPWDNDRGGRFTRKLFHWAEGHGRVRALIYYRSVHAGSPYDINHWRRARKVLRHELHKKRFARYASARHHRRHHRHRHHRRHRR